MATQRKDSELGALAERAERARADGDPGQFMSGGLVTSDFSIVLGGCIDFHPDLSELERNKIITRVAFGSGLSRPISAQGILKECSRLEQEYLAQPRKAFRILSEISIWSQINVPNARVGAASIAFKPRFVKGFSKRSQLFSNVRSSLGFDLPAHYQPVSISVSARTPADAAERALDSIDLLRASWNLALNRGKAWRRSDGRLSPVNDIRLGPFHTVHHPNGTLATETYWFDPAYSNSVTMFSDASKFQHVMHFTRNVRRRLAGHSYRQDVEAALLRYVRALDSADYNDAFLRLWSLLEFLTDSGQSPSKITVRRAAFMFADRERARLVLTHLTQHRNRFVHAGSDSGEIEDLVFLLKRHVDLLLTFHIGNSFRFRSRQDAASFMDMPPSRSKISAQIRRLRDAYQFVSPEA